MAWVNRIRVGSSEYVDLRLPLSEAVWLNDFLEYATRESLDWRATAPLGAVVHLRTGGGPDEEPDPGLEVVRALYAKLNARLS